MGFRQNNELNRKWNVFYQANRELIERIGLPGPTVDTLDRFADLLQHGMIDHHDDPTNFDLDELDPERLELFRVLIRRYFEAGFHVGPGLGIPRIVSPKDELKLVRKYPKQFSPQMVKWVNEHDDDIDEPEWLRAAANNPVFDFLKDPAEDIYNLSDGKPFNNEAKGKQP